MWPLNSLGGLPHYCQFTIPLVLPPNLPLLAVNLPGWEPSPSYYSSHVSYIQERRRAADSCLPSALCLGLTWYLFPARQMEEWTGVGGPTEVPSSAHTLPDAYALSPELEPSLADPYTCLPSPDPSPALRLVCILPPVCVTVPCPCPQ